MIVRTTRSGVVLHGAANCSDLVGKRVFVLDETDALPHARRCTHGACQVAFLRAPTEAKAA